MQNIWYVTWARKNIYKISYREIMKENLIGSGDQLKLIIDATNIANKTGSENVGYGSETKKKKFTKITVLSNNDAKIISVEPHKTNSKTITYDNGNQSKIQTLEHDTKGIIPAIKNLNTNKNIILTGDLGYLVNDDTKKTIKKNHNITLITPYRKNQKKNNTQQEKNELKTRYKVENAISKLKRFNRTCIRRDRKMNTFMGFIYLGFMCSS